MDEETFELVKENCEKNKAKDFYKIIKLFDR